MLTTFLTVTQQVVILFILIFVGFFCTKKKILTREGIKSITSLVLYVVIPCVIIDSFNRPFNKEMLSTMGIAFLAALCIHGLAILLVHLIVRDKEASRLAVLRFAAVFSNAAFMALPLQQALLGSDGVFYGTVYIAVFNLLSWTYGVFIMQSSQKNISIKSLIVNPGIIGVSIGLIIFLTSFKLPAIIAQPLARIAVLNTPLPMILIGYFLATTTNFSFFKDRNFMITVLLRLLVMPLLALGGLYFAGIRGILLPVMTIASSAPVAANTVMFAELYNRDVDLGAKLVSITTLLSIATMPPIVALAIYLSGFSA